MTTDQSAPERQKVVEWLDRWAARMSREAGRTDVSLWAFCAAREIEAGAHLRRTSASGIPIIRRRT